MRFDGKSKVTKNFYVFTGMVLFFLLTGQAFSSDGMLDFSFGTNGKTSFHFNNLHCGAYDAATQPDGKVVLVGFTGTADPNTSTSRFPFGGGPKYMDFAVARINTDGTLDTTFGSEGQFTLSLAPHTTGTNSGGSLAAVEILPDGKILAVGYYYFWGKGNDIVLIRLNSDGTLDESFGVGGVAYDVLVDSCPFDSVAYDMKVLDDGKTLVAGRGAPSGAYKGIIVRYNSNGTLDTSFNSKGYSFIGVTTDEGYQVDAQFFAMYVTENAIYGAGKVETKSSVSGQGDIFVGKFNLDGSVDTSFGHGKGYVTHKTREDDEYGNNWDDIAYGITTAPSGKLLVVGDYFDDGHNLGILCLNSDGSIDTSFGAEGTGFAFVTNQDGDDRGTGGLAGVRILNDRNILVWGWVDFKDSYDPAFTVARFLEDGTVDTSFGMHGGQTQVSISITEDMGQGLAFSPSGDSFYLAGLASNGSQWGVAKFNTGTGQDEGGGKPNFPLPGIIHLLLSGDNN